MEFDLRAVLFKCIHFLFPAEEPCNWDEIACDVEADSLCVPTWKLCNGAIDCPNGSDEVNCTMRKCHVDLASLF